jgi:uncharacterized membrane protein YbaN (DUF454 family)
MLTSSVSRKDSPGPSDFADSVAVQEPSVVHSSIGRLRVHLRYWSGTDGQAIVAEVRRLPGVTRAEANPVTRNVLILFEPRETSVAALLQALPALSLEPSVSLPSPANEPSRMLALAEPTVAQPCLSGGDDRQACLANNLEPSQQRPVYMTGMWRVLYKGLGWASVGMAVVGAITPAPGIPTAPFVILAGYFFIRSSPEAHAWLRQSRWFGPILRDWEDHHGVRRSIRNVALALIGGSMLLTLFLGLPTGLTVTIVACQVIGLAIVLRLRVVEPSTLGPASAAL